MDILRRKSSKAIEPVSTPSISMIPSTFANRNNADMSDDFPAPVLPTIPTCHLLCYLKKKTVVVCLYFFLKMNRQSLHSPLPGVLHIRVDTLINPDNAKSTSFFPYKLYAFLKFFTFNKICTSRRLGDNNITALELVEHKESLEPTYSHHTLSQLSEAAHEHASHSVCKNVEIGRNDEDLISSQIVAEHQHSDEGAIERHTSCEKIEGHVNAADVRALGDHSKFELTRQLHHSAEWLFPRVHFDHLHSGNDFVHQSDPLIGLDSSLETKL
ncbi:hypothetical protein ALC56_01168 [Trachymyrmex septentrionalis]|uniref:Uncharacterized protein n=1 Tax=Trachymyrmex septentrionalis TaxID=34720 RepID=A0A195FUZ1_9HYME|nr:hypothetical protein ALC56_01168 [Trachymyrmex septentrionalis]